MYINRKRKKKKINYRVKLSRICTYKEKKRHNKNKKNSRNKIDQKEQERINKRQEL